MSHAYHDTPLRRTHVIRRTDVRPCTNKYKNIHIYINGIIYLRILSTFVAWVTLVFNGTKNRLQCRYPHLTTRRLLYEKHVLHGLIEFARVDKRQAPDKLDKLLWLYKLDRSPQQRTFTSRKHLSVVRFVNFANIFFPP